jgi:hypothetical protein
MDVVKAIFDAPNAATIRTIMANRRFTFNTVYCILESAILNANSVVLNILIHELGVSINARIVMCALFSPNGHIVVPILLDVYKAFYGNNMPGIDALLYIPIIMDRPDMFKMLMRYISE